MREIKHLSIHQWLRSAIPDSQQPTSPIGFLFLKLPPPPCAVLLVYINHSIGLRMVHSRCPRLEIGNSCQAEAMAWRSCHRPCERSGLRRILKGVQKYLNDFPPNHCRNTSFPSIYHLWGMLSQVQDRSISLFI